MDKDRLIGCRQFLVVFLFVVFGVRDLVTIAELKFLGGVWVEINIMDLVHDIVVSIKEWSEKLVSRRQIEMVENEDWMEKEYHNRRNQVSKKKMMKKKKQYDVLG